MMEAKPYQIQHYGGVYIVTSLDPATHHWYVVARFNSLDHAVEHCKERYEPKEKPQKDALLETDIKDCDFSVRLLSCLHAANCKTVGDIIKLTKAKLLSYRNFGKKSICELEEWLDAHGLKLR